MKFGKRNGLIAINMNMLLAIGICLASTNIIVISIARLLWGISAGAFSVYCPKFLAEYIPVELRSSLGGIN